MRRTTLRHAAIGLRRGTHRGREAQSGRAPARAPGAPVPSLPQAAADGDRFNQVQAFALHRIDLASPHLAARAKETPLAIRDVIPPLRAGLARPHGGAEKGLSPGATSTTGVDPVSLQPPEH